VEKNVAEAVNWRLNTITVQQITLLCLCVWIQTENSVTMPCIFHIPHYLVVWLFYFPEIQIGSEGREFDDSMIQG
jgi:hypothetical protein